jgi:hypothetical protein
MIADPFARLDEMATVLPPDRWMLVGGLMVHAHAQLAAFPHVRSTDDADLVERLSPSPRRLGDPDPFRPDWTPPEFVLPRRVPRRP